MMMPMTELEAVNEMLRLIGELPVSDVNDSGVDEAARARDLLRTVSRDVQGHGLHCNTEEGYPLNLDSQGFINVPANAQVQCDSYRWMDITQRGTRIYNKEQHTYIFTQPLKVDIVFFLPFEELPQDARQYIAVRAGRMFIRTENGSDGENGMAAEDESKALVELRANEEIRWKNNMGRNRYNYPRAYPLGQL
jgi:hypothetical protein